MFAVANGDEAVAQRLLAAKANVNVKDFEGHMPLDYAINFCHTKLVEMLKDAGAVGHESEDEPEPASPTNGCGVPVLQGQSKAADAPTEVAASEAAEPLRSSMMGAGLPPPPDAAP